MRRRRPWRPARQLPLPSCGILRSGTTAGRITSKAPSRCLRVEKEVASYRQRAIREGTAISLRQIDLSNRCTDRILRIDEVAEPDHAALAQHHVGIKIGRAHV